jgi:3',5'-cyclic AMP phosphodiesterase CpdA
MLTIAQITDLHITSDTDPPRKKRNEARLRQALKAIHELNPPPSAIIASGDLVDRGEPEEYAELKAILKDVSIPIHLGIGNHDSRAQFRAAFPETPIDENGFVQYAVIVEGMRLVICDTVDEGREGGAFCSRRASWLGKTLDDEPDRPTLVVLHHPPIASGIQWMDPSPGEEWIKRLEKVLGGCNQVRSVICGHVHRAFHGIFAGTLLSASPATSPQLTLNMTDIDVRIPDGREIVREEPPGFSLHRWDANVFTTHVCVAGDFAPVAAYDAPFVED